MRHRDRARSLAPGIAALALLAVVVPARAHDCGPSLTVEAGDTLWAIGRRCDLTVDAIMAANPELRDPRALRVGATLRLPSAGGEGRAAGDDRAGSQDGSRARFEVTGRLTDEGVECPALRSDAGRLYTLIGQVRALPPGTRVQVRGTAVALSTCMQGTTIVVSSMSRLEDDDGDRDDAGDRVRIEGRLTDEGAECPAMRSDSGRLYTLAGEVPDWRAGTRVRVEGRRADMSTCMQGTTIAVSSVRRMDGDDGEDGEDGKDGKDGRMRVTGRLTGEGVECQAMRSDEGVLFTLTGNVPDWPPGTRLRVEGDEAQVSFCMQGTTLIVRRAEKL